MNVSDLLLCCWPGLPKLWLRGTFSSLIPAVLFAMTLNLAFISTFLWTDWASFVGPSLLWPIVVLFWLVGGYVGFQQLPKLVVIPEDVQPTGNEPDHLVSAQIAYLRGHYEEAEILVKRQLVRHPDDIPAGLFLGTLYRHRGQLIKARRQLSSLNKWDTAIRWQFEIDRELDQIEEQLTEEESLESGVEAPDTSSEPSDRENSTKLAG